MSRKDRLLEVYEYVRTHYPVHTQSDFAEKLKYHRTYISSAMHGNERNLTDKLFTTICEVFPDFNLDYLLTGRGNLTLGENKIDVTQISNSRNVTPESHLDISSVINTIIAAKDDAIESLKRELATKDDLIQSLRDQLAAKDQLIAEQKARLIEYRRTIDSKSDLSDYPFPIGAADKSKRKPLRN